MASWIHTTRIALAALFASLTLGSSPASAHPILETGLTFPGARDSYKVISGSFDPTQSEELAAWLKSATAGMSYFEIDPIESDAFRSPQSIPDADPPITRPSGWASRLASKIPGALVRPVVRINEKMKPWLHDPENRVILTFTLIAGAVDGTLNSGSLIVFEHTPVEMAMGVGATIGFLSASWSALTPQIAKFLNGKPSAIDKIFKRKESPAYGLGKFFEGMLKWGVIQFAVTSVISAVSHHLGAMHFDSVADWTQSSFVAAWGIVVGQGVLDYSLSVELIQQRSRNESEAANRKALLKNYAFGTVAASLATLGSIATLLKYDFTDYLVGGMFATGFVNLGRIRWPAIQAFVKKLPQSCDALMVPLKAVFTPAKSPDGPPSDGYGNWGSE